VAASGIREGVLLALSTDRCGSDRCGADRVGFEAAGVEIGAGGGGGVDATFFLQPVQSTDNAVMATQAIYRVFIK
jgi:hypothetical protein